MSVTYGFYNSLNHDRKYDAVQLSSIFDGIIKDGIYMAIGGQLKVSAGTGMTVIVETGRAWFDHTWTLNDARLPLTLEQSEVILKRIDLVILEVNADPALRKNDIKILKGVPSQNPVWPTVVNSGFLHQYVLAAISVAPNVTSIRQADIENRVGMSDTPFVTGIIQTMNIDSLIAQWKDQWRVFYEKQVNDVESWTESHKTEWQKWFTEYSTKFEIMISTWYEEQSEEFVGWFNDLEDLLDENAEAKMANEILKLTKKTTSLMDIPRYTLSVTLPASKWAGSGPWTQVINNSVINKDDQPFCALNYDPPSEIQKRQMLKQWGFVDLSDTSDGSIMFTCKFKKPTIDIPIFIRTGGGGSIDATALLSRIVDIHNEVIEIQNAQNEKIDSITERSEELDRGFDELETTQSEHGEKIVALTDHDEEIDRAITELGDAQNEHTDKINELIENHAEMGKTIASIQTNYLQVSEEAEDNG